MDSIRIRKCFNPYTEKWEAIAFITNAPANPGYVLSYQHVGQHGEASIEFMQACEKCEDKLAIPLIEELKSIGYIF